MNRRLIVCGGMNRSGSTWQFNAARTLLAAVRPADEIYSCWVDDYAPGHPAPLHVVKAHVLHQVKRYEPDDVLTSYRDLRAVAGSLIRMRWASPDIAHLFSYCDMYVENCAALEQVACHVMRYEHLLTDPRNVLRHIAMALQLNVSEAQLDGAEATLGALKPPEGQPTGTITEVDADTLLHRGHVGDGTNAAAMQFITSDAMVAIGARYSQWLEDHGYEPAPSASSAASMSAAFTPAAPA